MNIIYFGNGDYEQQSINLNKIIQNIIGNYDLMIYGGNYTKTNTNANTNANTIDTTKFLQTINKLSDKKTNIIMFGNYDLSNKKIFEQEMEFYKTNKKFKISNVNKNNFLNDYVVDNSLIIFFDSNLLLWENYEDLVTGTIYENLFCDFSTNINMNKDKKIKDLINYQFECILKTIKKNQNIINLIFITQNPLFVQNKNLKTYKFDEFYKWISDFYIFITNYNIFWLCSNLNYCDCTYETGIIEIESNNKKILTLTQHIVGITKIAKIAGITETTETTKTTKTNDSKQSKILNFDSKHKHNMNISFKSKFTNLTYQINVFYQIKNKSNSLGYITSKKYFDDLFFEFIDLNKKEEENKNKSDDYFLIDYDIKKDHIIENNSKKSKYSKYNNILKNDEISVNLTNLTKSTNLTNFTNLTNLTKSSESNSPNELTKSVDPYKSRYLKYKAKLFKLRNNKKQ